MIAIVVQAAWLTLLIALFRPGAKVDWTDLLLWLLGFAVAYLIVYFLLVGLAGPIVALIVSQLAYGAGMGFLLYHRYGFQRLGQLALLLVLLYLPQILFVLYSTMKQPTVTP